MPFRKTELELLNDELAAAGATLQAAEQAHRDLAHTLDELTRLDDRIQELSRAEREVLYELERLTSAGWYALYNSVLGTVQDKHEVELAALARVQGERRQHELHRDGLQKRVEALLARTRTHDDARSRFEAAIEKKERLLRNHDTSASRRLWRVAEEEQQIGASLERIDRAIRSRQARGASGRELKMLRSVWRETLAKKTALAQERRAIVLDGLDLSWRAAS
jgi:SMC interacting uncharacterized protein involved in chromosome segregation